jgi:hypothetical protein
MIMTGSHLATLTTGGRQALWWARYGDHPDPATALAEARKLADQLAGLPHLAGWRFVVRDEPEQHRVTVIGTATGRVS